MPEVAWDLEVSTESRIRIRSFDDVWIGTVIRWLEDEQSRDNTKTVFVDDDGFLVVRAIGTVG